MGLPDTIRRYSLTATVVMFAVTWGVALGVGISKWLEFLYQRYCRHYESKARDMDAERRRRLIKQREHLLDLERLKNTYDPIHLVFAKIESAHDGGGGGDSESGIKCAICSTKFGNDERCSGQWVTVMPCCHRVCHTECASELFVSQVNTCPVCPRRVNLKDLKDIMITIKPLDSKDKTI